jgi:hypothetical protein
MNKWTLGQLGKQSQLKPMNKWTLGQLGKQSQLKPIKAN